MAGLFVAGAIYAWIEGTRNGDAHLPTGKTARGTVTTAFVVIFLAEWRDLTQILTANLAVHYHAPLPVALGSLLALWVVAALAVASGQTLLRFLSITAIRKITAIVLLCLAGYTAWTALG